MSDMDSDNTLGDCPIHNLPFGELRIKQGWSFVCGECHASLVSEVEGLKKARETQVDLCPKCGIEMIYVSYETERKDLREKISSLEQENTRLWAVVMEVLDYFLAKDGKQWSVETQIRIEKALKDLDKAYQGDQSAEPKP